MFAGLAGRGWEANEPTKRNDEKEDLSELSQMWSCALKLSTTTVVNRASIMSAGSLGNDPCV